MKSKIFLLLLLAFTFASCTQKPTTEISEWTPYDESEEIAANADHESRRMRFKHIQSLALDKNDLWKDVAEQIKYFSEEDYEALKPLIFDQDIPTLQAHIKAGNLSYEKLTQWYLYRIVKFENNKDKMLNAMVAINAHAVAEAKLLDQNKSVNDHLLYGMPVLLKDNVNAEGMPTTAGTYLLRNNIARDAFIVERLKEKGAIILGKTNLSEWANFLTVGGPNGYSAVGGQTLNPYGRKIFDTGGSSSGSGAAIAANYAVAAVGTETSGSILSPSSQNSLVGLKPTVGLLSRAGIVPLSSTLDTPGPMTRNIIDNAIFLSAMTGEDAADPATKNNPKGINYLEVSKSGTLVGLRFGAIKRYMEHPVYKATLDILSEMGAIIIEFEPEQVNFDGFGDLLSADMKIDLPNYLNEFASEEITSRTMPEIVIYNNEDTSIRIPYGQGRFEAASKVELTTEEHSQLRDRLNAEGIKYFEVPMKTHQLDAILSINNRGAGFAAAAKYPCLTIPMGYEEDGYPCGLTFIARPFEEDKLLKMGFAFEQATKMRKSPKSYQ